MVALNEQFHHKDTTVPRRGLQGTGAGRAFRSWELGVRMLWKRCAAKCEMLDAGYGLQRGGESVRSAKSADSYNHQRSRITDHKFGITRDLFNDQCSLLFERSADAYGNTLMFTGPGADGIWFTNDDVQSNYGANEIIFCGYRFDPETELYYVRNRTYSPILGRWLQRDPIGYAGGINLYEYVNGNSIIMSDPSGLGCCSSLKKAYDAAEAAANQARKNLLQALADANKWLLREQRDARLVDVYSGKAEELQILYRMELVIVANLMKEEDTDPNAVTPGALSEAQHLQIKYLNDYRAVLAQEQNAKADEIRAHRWWAYYQTAINTEQSYYDEAMNKARNAERRYRNCLSSGAS